MLFIKISVLKTNLLPQQKDLIEKKIRQLEKYCRYFRRNLNLDISIEKANSLETKNVYTAEARLYIPGNDIYSKVEASSIEELADSLKDNLKRLIIEHKKTRESFFRRTARKFKEKLFWHRLK